MAGYTPVGIGGNAPKAVGSPLTYNFLGAQTLNNFAVLNPDVDPDLTKRYGNQKDIITMFEKLGMVRKLSNSTIFRHFEEDRLHAPVAMAATNAGLANAGVVIAIAAGDVFDIGQTSPYIGAAVTEAIVPRVNDVGFFPNGVEGIVTAIDPATPSFTVSPTQLGENIPAILNGDLFVITTNAVQEGSGVRQSKSSRVILYENNMQIVREDYSSTGSARGEAIWFTPGGEYGSGQYWFYYDMDRTFRRFKDAKAMAAIFGKSITNTTLAGIAGFETVKKTLGLVPTIEASGNVEAYVAGAITLADFSNISDVLMEQGAPNQYLMLCSHNFRKDINTLARQGDGATFNQAGRSSIVFAEWNGGVQSVDFDLDVMKLNGFEYNICQQRTFSDPTQLGAVAKYQNFCVGIPMGTTNIYEEIGGDHVEVPSVAVVYKGDGSSGDRSLIETVRGIDITGEDRIQHTLLSEFGIETYAANQMFTMQG